MPDGDRVHSGLDYQYQKVYMQICERNYGNAFLAHNVVAAMRKNLQQIGLGPTELAARVATDVAHIQAAPLFRALVDWGFESYKIEQHAQTIEAPRRATNLAIEACKELLQDIRHGNKVDNFAERVVERFLQKLYAAEFEERMPFRASEIGVDHTRAVHPLSLALMSELVSHILNTPFHFQNPFLFQTKAQMCMVLHSENAVSLTAETLTCDHLHREHPMQCGYCSSCLLRRQALLTSGITDPTEYIITSLQKIGKPYRVSYSNHFQAMQRQVQKFRQLMQGNDAWHNFAGKYATLVDIVDRTAAQHGLQPDTMGKHLITLYQRYIAEWAVVEHVLGKELDIHRNICVAV